MRYEPLPGVLEELEELVAAEADCCSFATWRVVQDADSLVMTVTVDPRTPEAIAGIASLFGLA